MQDNNQPPSPEQPAQPQPITTNQAPELTPQPIPAPPTPTPVPSQPMTTTVQSKKPKTKLIILVVAVVLILLGLGAGAFLLLPQMNSQPQPTMEPTPEPTPVPQPKEDQMSGITNSIPVTADTVSAAQAENKYYLSYKGKYYAPVAPGTMELEEIDLDNPETYTWHGIVNVVDGDVFDFATLPNINPGFAFIMHYPFEDKDRYELFYYAFNEANSIATFDEDTSKLVYRIPKFYSINDAGTLGALHMYDCWDCERHYPQTQVVNFISKEMQVLGPTSVFNWGTDENFEYKDYQSGVDPATLPLKTGSFKF